MNLNNTTTNSDLDNTVSKSVGAFEFESKSVSISKLEPEPESESPYQLKRQNAICYRQPERVWTRTFVKTVQTKPFLERQETDVLVEYVLNESGEYDVFLSKYVWYVWYVFF